MGLTHPISSETFDRVDWSQPDRVIARGLNIGTTRVWKERKRRGMPLTRPAKNVDEDYCGALLEFREWCVERNSPFPYEVRRALAAWMDK